MDSGSPYSITDNFTGFANSVFNGIGGRTTRPNQIANPGLPNPSNAEFFNNTAFEVPLLGTIGNAGRNTLYGPSFRYFTFSVFKDFPIRERLKLQFRTDTFNRPTLRAFSFPTTRTTTPQRTRCQPLPRLLLAR